MIGTESRRPASAGAHEHGRARRRANGSDGDLAADSRSRARRSRRPGGLRRSECPVTAIASSDRRERQECHRETSSVFHGKPPSLWQFRAPETAALFVDAVTWPSTADWAPRILPDRRLCTFLRMPALKIGIGVMTDWSTSSPSSTITNLAVTTGAPGTNCALAVPLQSSCTLYVPTLSMFAGSSPDTEPFTLETWVKVPAPSNVRTATPVKVSITAGLPGAGRVPIHCNPYAPWS